MVFTKKAIKALEKVAIWLEAGAPHEKNHGMEFDMNYLLRMDHEKNLTLGKITEDNMCGTVCCSAGALVSFNKPSVVVRPANKCDEDVGDFWSDACKLIGFDPDESDEDGNEAMSHQLFQPWLVGWSVEPEDITPDWAARTIRHLIATGKVEWHETRLAS